MISYFPLQGGEDLTTPALSVDPGKLRYSLNYECDDNGRYRRIDGYERFDGRPKPSEASYWVLDFDAGEGEISVGDTVEGGTSGATGEVLVVTVESGAWGTSDAAGYLVLFNLSGAYQNNEDLEVSAVKKAVADGTEDEGADGDTNYDTWIQAAIEATRSDIQAVSGSGPVLGVWQYNGVKYAFRNNAGATKAVMFKSSAAGWVECTLGRTVAFTSGGTHEVLVDDTLTGATSGATAVVKRIILSSGTWAGGDAAGTFVLYSQSGTFQSENLNEGANSNVCTIAANSTETTLAAATTSDILAGTQFEFINYNFGGHSGTYRMYGCDGNSKAFEWDGSVFVPITTGMTTDKPKHIIAHEKHLFLSFSGGSVQHSSIGDPYTWSVVTGASELGMGDEVTGFMSMPKALTIFSRRSTKILYGSSSSDWDLRTLSEESGGIERTIQKMGATGIYLDDRGLTNLSSVDTYGDFTSNAISAIFDPVIKQAIIASTSQIKTNACSSNGDCATGYVCSTDGWCVPIIYISTVKIRDKNQYRFFTNNGTSFILKMNKNKVVGFTRIAYSDTVTCCNSTEDSNGNEEIFFGSTDGYVYEMDKGTSFDGSAIAAYLKTHFNNFKTPMNKKRFRKVKIELDAPNAFTLNVRPDFDYGGYQEGWDTQGLSISEKDEWTSDIWSSFTWTGPAVSTGAAYIDGSGKNLSLDFYTTGTYDQPHTIQGLTVNYDVRGIER